jgi:hypothetical protein
LKIANGLPRLSIAWDSGDGAGIRGQDGVEISELSSASRPLDSYIHLLIPRKNFFIFWCHLLVVCKLTPAED